MFDLRMAQFNDNIKFRWRKLNINNLMLINLHLINNETIFSIFWPSQLQNSNLQRIVAGHQQFQ